MENAIDRKERTVYVTGMSAEMTEDVLYNMLERAGPIEKVILKENADGTPQHALVIFKNVESVMIAISSYNGTTVYDQPIGLRPLRESSHHSVLEQAIKDQMRAGIPQHRYPTRQTVRYQQQIAAASAAPPQQTAVTPPTAVHHRAMPQHPIGPIGAAQFMAPNFAPWNNHPNAGYYEGAVQSAAFGGYGGWTSSDGGFSGGNFGYGSGYK